MFKIKAIPAILIALLPGLCFPQNLPDEEVLKKIISEKGQAEVAIPFPGRRELENISKDFSVISVRDDEVRIKLAQPDVSGFTARGFEFRIIERADAKGLAFAPTLAKAMEWNTYPSYTQYVSIMQHFAATFPSLCMLDTIGTSVNGRLVLALKISGNCRVDEPEPEVFLTSSIHGDETAGFILLLRLADHFLGNYLTDSRVQNLVDNLAIWINPLANPDGAYRNGDFIVSPVRNNANGYDLNRNFPDPEKRPPVLQKETIDMMRFLSARRFALSVNLHSGEEVVNYPWDRWATRHADDDWFYSISREWADTAHVYARKGYMDFLDNGVTNGYSWYPVFGGRQDYVTYELGGREITVELDTNFVTPAADLDDLWEYNYRSMLNFIETALHGIRGTVSDVMTGSPVAARVFINGHDTGNSHVFTDTASGFFTRYLYPGNYNLTFSAAGYHDTTIYSINVADKQTTFLDAKMQRVINPVDTTDQPRPYIYPNPATGYINVVLPVYLHGKLNMKIFNISGVVMSDHEIETVPGVSARVDVSTLERGTYFILFRNLSTGRTALGKFVHQ